ncbi:hypothetical protein PF007_g13823 [Phytophthora fragariae]|uniref:Uncharacterized protein n=1 Tax=Phytophthora fragariae TaxID=53985 RepID=A0A6A3RWV0_9STRA|nr:hypothetical protein PF007_g13823 [Phytophthora fragariae]
MSSAAIHRRIDSLDAGLSWLYIRLFQASAEPCTRLSSCSSSSRADSWHEIRLGATIGFLLCPQTSVPAIAWIFAVLLVRVVFGIVLPYGRNKLREDEGDLDSQRTCRLFSSLSVEEGIPLVSSSSSKTATYNV